MGFLTPFWVPDPIIGFLIPLLRFLTPLLGFLTPFWVPPHGSTPPPPLGFFWGADPKPPLSFKVFADYEAYVKCQERVSELYKVRGQGSGVRGRGCGGVGR